jgi:hypothetical protein
MSESKNMEINEANLPHLKEKAAKMSSEALLEFYNQYEKPVKKFDSHEKAVFHVRALMDRLSIDPNYKHESHKNKENKKMKNETKAAEATEPVKTGRKGLTDEEKAAKAKEKADAKAALKLEKAQEQEAKKKRKEEEKAAKAAAKASPAFRYEPNPSKAPHAVRVGSMVSKMIDLIARPQGATIEELEAVAYSTSHSVKSLLNYDMRNQVGYGYYSSEDGKTVYILYPAGMSAPLPHAEKPAPKVKEPKPPKEPKAPKEAKAPKVAKGEAVAEQPSA